MPSGDDMASLARGKMKAKRAALAEARTRRSGRRSPGWTVRRSVFPRSIGTLLQRSLYVAGNGRLVLVSFVARLSARTGTARTAGLE